MRARHGEVFASHFWSGFDRSGECWVWQRKSRHDFGYGITYKDGKTRLTHNVAWEITFGPIPKGQQVLHQCDNPPCGNPSHLFLGTQLENVRDMIRKGRRRPSIDAVAGENHPAAKLDENKIKWIRILGFGGYHTHRWIAEIMGISRAHVGKIINRKVWNRNAIGNS